ncbi:MAG: methionyl-tRNA formyltransferase [Anaerolineales bacterium]|nr:methionyl-tRNA formyltransferase [Anaerolineales bacterium]
MSKIVFMGTPEFSVPALQKLVTTQTVVGVVTQPDRPAGRGQQLRPSPVKVVAEAAGIPVYQPRSLRSEEAADPLREWQPDIIVVAAFGQILRPHVLDLPPHGCVNVHASLLPRWRGASPIQHALMAGDSETGICLMRMDPGLDTGPVYVCRATPITATDTAATLHDRLAELGGDLLEEHLDAIIDGRLAPTTQDDTLSTYAPMIKKEDGRLDWTQSAAYLDRHVRAMTPWPGAYTTWQGQPLKILGVRPVERKMTGAAGMVVSGAAGDTAVVVTGDGGLELQTVQPAGKRAMDIAEFLNGRPEFIGSQLGEAT